MWGEARWQQGAPAAAGAGRAIPQQLAGGQGGDVTAASVEAEHHSESHGGDENSSSGSKRCPSLEPRVTVEVEGVHVGLAAHAGHVPPHAAGEGEARCS